MKRGSREVNRGKGSAVEISDPLLTRRAEVEKKSRARVNQMPGGMMNLMRSHFWPLSRIVCLLLASLIWAAAARAQEINFEEMKMNGVLATVAAADFEQFKSLCVDGEHPPLSKEAFDALRQKIYPRLSHGFHVHVMGSLRRPNDRVAWICSLSFEDTIVMDGHPRQTGELLLTVEFKGEKLSEFSVRE